MAYDGKNSYPERGARFERYKITFGAEPPDTLGSRAVRNLKSCSRDMDALSGERKRLLAAYNAADPKEWAKTLKNVAGRSQVIMSDVSDTVETLMPYLMDMFWGSRNVVSVRPMGPEDEEPARLMEEKINYDLQYGLNGFALIYTFIKDALINKLGVVKYYWVREKTLRKTGFKKLTTNELNSLITSGEYVIDKIVSVIRSTEGKIVEIEDTPDIEVFEGETIEHDVECRKITLVSKPYAENIPPEEFIFDFKARSIEDAFKAHRKKVHKNHLKDVYGLTDEEIKEVLESFWDDPQVIERYRDLGGSLFVSDSRKDEFFYINECYIDDYDSKGRKIPKIVTIFGDRVIRIIDNNNGAGFVVASPILMPHRICGKSVAELAIDIQELRSALVRFTLDNIYFSTSGRLVVNPFRVDMDSVLSSNRPGGVAWTKFDINPQEGIFPMPLSNMPPYVMKMMEYVELMRENRTGVARYVGGIDPQSLNRTATGITTIMNAAQQRIRLIARVFAETGVRDLYRAFVDMNLRFFDRAVSVKLNKNWQIISPEMIDGKFDVIIDVGANSGVKELQFNQKIQMLQIYAQIANMLGPATQTIFTADNLRNILRSMWEDMLYKNVDEYVTPDEVAKQMMQQITGGVNVGQSQGQQWPSGGGGANIGEPPYTGIFSESGEVPERISLAVRS